GGNSVATPSAWSWKDAIKYVPELMQAYSAVNRGLLQRKFMDSSSLSDYANNLAARMSKGTRNLYHRDVMNTAAEGGWAGSPGMIQSATAREMAPYYDQMRQRDLAAALQAWELAQQEDPMGPMNEFSQLLQLLEMQQQFGQAQQREEYARNY